MKKRLLAFLLAVSMAVSMLALPAAAAGNANTAVQLSITLDGMDSTQTAALNAVVTRGAFARMLVAYSTFRESVGSQGAVGTLYKDLPGSSAYAPYVRIAVQQGWMSGYTDGTFRPDNAVTLEEAVTAVLKLLGYKMTDLSGSFPQAQLNKASELGLRNQLERQQGEALNYEECAILFYNALTANAASGSAYGTSLGFTVSNGQVDTSSVMLSSLKGPFIADGTTQLPFAPVSVYRNDKVSSSAELTKYDVYYYSESLQTVWIYTRRAAGRITAVSPSASAPTSVTVAGSTYTLGSSAVASQVSSVMLSSLKGPFIADGTTQLPFAPVSVYRNDKVSSSAELTKYDVYYYSESLQTVWIYTRRAAGRITAVSPSASAPTSVTVAGSTYTLGSSAVASQVSSLNGGGVGQVVTLLLGMNNEAAGIVTGEEADSVFYGVVQSSARSLIEENGADVLQKVAVLCTDGITRTVNVDKSLNFPAGWLVEITVGPDGENVEHVRGRSTSGTINENATALGDAALADDVEILDTTSEGVAGTVRPSRLSGVTLSSSDIRYYTVNEAGQIDRLILNDVTGDLWKYGVLDDVKNLAVNYTDLKSFITSFNAGANSSGGSSTAGGTITETTTGNKNGTTGSADSTTQGTVTDQVTSLLVPTTSEILWGIVSGDILSTAWQKLTSNTGSLLSIGFKQVAEITGTPFKQILRFIGGGATYVCYVNGSPASFSTAIKYPVIAGGVAVRQETTGSVKSMVQLMPLKIDRVGAASVLSGNTRYEMADDAQVYLWYKGQYYPTRLASVNTDEYKLTGWYDNFGCTAGKKVRVIIAVKND